ncbi:MAG: hotdog fold thioesterase [Chitinophagales bacterium]|nr:hotdog fold thioesterase [Chitinophagales bacterium]
MVRDEKLEELNRLCQNTLMEHLSIEYTERGDGYLCARMPVNSKVHQPFGLLHGGASAALAESVGSAASLLEIGNINSIPLAKEINISHLRSTSTGNVYAKATLLNKSRSSHVWDIRIKDDEGRLISVSRLNMSIVEKKEDNR